MTTTEWRRRLGAVLLAVLVALGVAGCDSSGGSGPSSTPAGGEPDDPPGEVAEPAADFDATIDVGDDAVTVRYTLTNRSGGDLLVTDRPPVQVGAGVRYSPDETYVVGQGDGRVQISQRAFATPDPSRVDFAQPPRVGATTLADGEELSGSVEVPVPLARSYPFGDDLGYGEIRLPDPVRQVTFCLGVLPPPYDPAINKQTEDGTTTIAHDDVSNAGQHLFCSDAVDL